MADIRFETGVVSYNINGVCEVFFNPTDSAFVKRLFDAFEYLDKKQEAYRDEASKVGDHKQIFELSAKWDKDMREIMDGVFHAPVCEAVFGDMNVYAYANGLPVWCNLMLAVIEEIDTTFAREQKATNARIKKYTQKYQNR